MASRPPPTLYVVAGPNGSGKSTLAEQLRRAVSAPPQAWINADEIVDRMRAAAHGNADRSLAAAIEADRLRHAALEAGDDVMTETVMSDERWLPFFAKARGRGYRIALYFVTTCDPAINVARVKMRVALGGHAVPEERVRSRYAKVMERMLPRVLPMTDKSYLFDNSGVAAGLELLAVYTGGTFNLRPAARASRLRDWLDRLILQTG